MVWAMCTRSIKLKQEKIKMAELEQMIAQANKAKEILCVPLILLNVKMRIAINKQIAALM